ncbi:electron transfer flavoprotein subunit alpha/FixB family protein [Propionicicella superfundia]|uniref:electron transfer flavoprotein subunit alpha/FixB family protein n=1 Tax=Propionicicella superfundia TaxID=348582 RepID=UPI000490D2C6|nr:electron transfer flavoprotein subunit alpha/FixB family protein [Propionicicella superfundia]
MLELGRARGGDVIVVAVGDAAAKAGGGDRVIRVEVAAGTPLEAVAPVVAAHVDPQPGDVVLTGSGSADRAIAGAVAARHGLPVARGVNHVATDEVRVPRYGGIAEETVSLEKAILLVVDAHGETEGEAAAGEPAEGDGYAATISGIDPGTSQQANLPAARRIVACGRGFKAESELQLASDLAVSIGAELACSRPLAEGSGWFPRDRYIGVSGSRVAPDIYLAVGISGQVQHTVGMKDSRVVVAINSDPQAPIFTQADYGIVGDLHEVLPALTAALGR